MNFYSRYGTTSRKGKVGTEREVGDSRKKERWGEGFDAADPGDLYY